MARRGLGRGLDALIPDRTETAPSEKNGSGNTKKTGAKAGKKSNSAGAKKNGGNKKKNAASVKVAEKKSSETSSGNTAAGGDAENASVKSSRVSDEATAGRAMADPDRKSAERGNDRQKADTGSEVVNMRISLVEPNRSQPRKYFDDDAIAELADSIRQFGVIQPLLVQEKDGYYEIIAGERRWRAAQKAGLKEVPVIIRHFSSQEAVEVALIENIQREDLNPIEEAKAYERLVSEYGLSQEAVAGRVSKSRSSVTNSMRLLRLDSSVQKMVETSQISEGHARALLGLTSPEAQKKAAQEIVDGHLSVRQTEKLVRDANRPEKVKKETEKENDPMLDGLAGNMTTALGTKVSIRSSGKDRGRIEIEYYSADELDRIYELLLSAT